MTTLHSSSIHLVLEPRPNANMVDVLPPATLVPSLQATPTEKQLTMNEWTDSDYDKPSEEPARSKYLVVDYMLGCGVDLYHAHNDLYLLNKTAVKMLPMDKQINTSVFETCYFVPHIMTRACAAQSATHPQSNVVGGLLALRFVPEAHHRGRVWDSHKYLETYRPVNDNVTQLAIYNLSFIKDKDDDENDVGNVMDAENHMEEATFLRYYPHAQNWLIGPDATSPYLKEFFAAMDSKWRAYEEDVARIRRAWETSPVCDA